MGKKLYKVTLKLESLALLDDGETIGRLAQQILDNDRANLEVEVKAFDGTLPNVWTDRCGVYEHGGEWHNVQEAIEIHNATLDAETKND